MKFFLKLFFILSLITFILQAESEKIKGKQVNFSLVIAGGVSLGAYEAGYNWALIKLMAKIKLKDLAIDPELSSIAGASAGSLNSILSAMYWCQKDSIPLKNTIEDNLFYETWINIGMEDLLNLDEDPDNKSALMTLAGFEKKGEGILEHMQKPIYKKNCEVPLGIAVTKVKPIVENISGIKMKNQNFSVPLLFKVKNGRAIVENKVLPPSSKFYISIPGIEKDRSKVIDLLMVSAAFPGAFPQRKLEYNYKGKTYSHYFIDGGLYDNVPLDLAISLNKNAEHFFFMDPSNMRKEIVTEEKEEEEKMPVGFISTNLLPVFSSFDIMQSMKLYDAINKHFREGSDKQLTLSSRFHPITGKYLAHFGAFLDRNFRVYDYHVGVYDAIYHIAAGIRKHQYVSTPQIVVMNHIKTFLGVDDNPEALAAYNLFLNTEFHDLKPKNKDLFSTIYNAFNLEKPEATRYDSAEFKTFLSKLDMNYLEERENSFIAYAQSDIDNWYKKPIRVIVNRVNTLENDRDEVGLPNSYGTATSVGAWAASDLTKEKRGFEFVPLDVPDDKGKEGLRTALRFIPGEIGSDVKNGGLSFGYYARYYKDMNIIDGFEGKLSYSVNDQIPDFVRLDVDAFKAYSDVLTFGLGG